MKRYTLGLLTLLVIIGLLFPAACFSSPRPSGTVPVSPAAEKPREEVKPLPSPEPRPTEEAKPSPLTGAKPAEEVKPLPSPKPEAPAVKAEPEPEEIPSFPLTITDDLGRKVKIEKLPRRIISLAPSNTEILFALGLEDSIVGVTQYCNYPEAAKSKPRVAGYSTPSLEKVVSLKPDLILAESIHEKMALPAMEKLGLTVVVMSAGSLDSVLKEITLVGQITGRSRTAARLVDNLGNRLKAVAAKTQSLTPQERPKVLYVVWHDPVWTMGSETFIDDLIQKAGGVNIFATEFKKSRAVSIEAIVARNPEIIIVSDMGTASNLIYNSIKSESRLSGVAAMVKGRVYQIEGDLIERPGPRIVDGLEKVARFLHPEIFGPPEIKP